MDLASLLASHRRQPTTRLTALFQWDQRFGSRCFGKKISPSCSDTLRKYLSTKRDMLEVLFASEGQDETYRLKLSTIETFVAFCCPTDAQVDNIKVAADYLICFLAVKDLLGQGYHNRQEFLPKLVAALCDILDGGEGMPECSDVEERFKIKASVLLGFLRDFCGQLTWRVAMECSPGSKEQLGVFYRSFGAALRAVGQEATNMGTGPEDVSDYRVHRRHSIGVEPWLHLWATLGFPSDPFLNYHNTDHSFQRLVQLVVEVVFLTHDVGSVIKDCKKGGQNAVLSVAHHTKGATRMDAVDIVISMIERSVDEFFEIGASIPLVEADALWYVELLKKAMRANWLCQKKLWASFIHEVEEK